LPDGFRGRTCATIGPTHHDWRRRALSPKEEGILLAITEGHSNKAIAAHLSVTEDAVNGQ